MQTLEIKKRWCEHSPGTLWGDDGCRGEPWHTGNLRQFHPRDKELCQRQTDSADHRYGNKPKVLMVFGNPAFHSVINGMFFFSRANNQRHGMWGKLQKAHLIEAVHFSNDNLILARKLEAEKRKSLISAGNASDMFTFGMTTFYSFPTPVKGRFRDVQGVEKLFKPVLEDIISFEVHRIQNYAFTQDAILVFVQKSSYETFRRHSTQEALFWPVRGKNSSGEDLSQMLKEKLSGKGGLP